MIRVGVIGYGYWGPNLVRVFMASDSATVTRVADLSNDRLRKVNALYPSVKVSRCAHELMKDPQVDAVVIATPVDSHFELGMKALAERKHVLVEKPIAMTSEQAKKMIHEACRFHRVLMVDHTFIYTAAVRKMREIIRSKKFGTVRYYDSTRVNLGLFQSDINVLWDLAVHDLSIMNYVLGQAPCEVSATGFTHLKNNPQYAGYLTLFFQNMIAHINVNWLSPVKIRRTLVGGSRQMIVYDDLETNEKIKVYDKGISIQNNPEQKYKTLISYRTGDLWVPKIEETEALKEEIAHFIRCIQQGLAPLTGGEAGLQLVRILEAADRSMKKNGAPEKI